MIQRSSADQIDIGSDGAGSFLGQAADHQGVFKGAGGFLGQTPKQWAFLVGQLEQPGSGEQSEEALKNGKHQQSQHQQQTQE